MLKDTITNIRFFVTSELYKHKKLFVLHKPKEKLCSIWTFITIISILSKESKTIVHMASVEGRHIM